MRRLSFLAAAALLAAIHLSPPALAAAALDGSVVAQFLAPRQNILDEPLAPTATAESPAAASGASAKNAVIPSSTLDMAAWDRETSAICIARLSTLEVASNPSGAAICYNIPMLNNQTGRFMADLRLYKISEPVGVFAGVAPQNIQVGLSYNGATVSRVSKTAGPVAARSARDEGAMEGLDYGRVVRRSDPQELQTYMFVGQIDAARMDVSLSAAAMEALIIPALTLSAAAPNGQVSTANVSSNEASFLIGAFSDMTFQSAFSKALDRVNEQMAHLAAGEVAFVLPGVHIMIFPIGLVITSIWLGIGLAAYGFGTWQRYNYAHQFRRRRNVATLGGKSTF